MTHSSAPDQADVARQMRLRPAPPPVMRLSRKALMAAGGVAALIVAGALAFALLERPTKASKPELYRVGGPPAESVQALPRDYAVRPGASSAPVLGPPLPGDLGHSIVAAQNQGVDVGVPAMGSQALIADTPAPRAEPARHRAAEERDAARLSPLFLEGLETSPSAANASDASSVRGLPTQALGRPDHQRPTTEAALFAVQAGAILSGAMVTGLRSDLPGSAIGQITDDVYDSVTGRTLLIPKGSRLVGAYASNATFGQSRLAVVWSRLILPDGRSIPLEDFIAADPQGFSGLEDGVDNRWSERLRTAALTTLLAVGASAGVGGRDNDVARALAQGLSGGVNTFGQGLVEKGLTIAPRLTIRPGFPFRVIVTRDLVLEPYGDR